MIRHIVLYCFKPDCPEQDILNVFNKLAKLKELVPGVAALEWGPYCGKGPQNAGYNYGLSVDVVDESVFVDYSPHPLHMEVRREMAPMLSPDVPLLMFDFVLSQK